MVRAFASLLMRGEDGRHWLVTPHQKLAIEVEDAAFVAVDCVERGGALAFRLNTDEIVIADAAHALTSRGQRGRAGDLSVGSQRLRGAARPIDMAPACRNCADAR
jgi:hypothetical protein